MGLLYHRRNLDGNFKTRRIRPKPGENAPAFPDPRKMTSKGLLSTFLTFAYSFIVMFVFFVVAAS
jgi:hypothetical protein